MADMQRMFLYFLERVDREDSDGMVTIGNERANNHKHFRKKIIFPSFIAVFDCAGCGLRNMDMDFIRYMVSLIFMQSITYF